LKRAVLDTFDHFLRRRLHPHAHGFWLPWSNRKVTHDQRAKKTILGSNRKDLAYRHGTA